MLLGPILLNLRRWRVPFGATTLIFIGFGLLVNIMTAYRDIVLIIPLIITGLAIDLLAAPARRRARTAGSRSAASARSARSRR